MSLSCIGFLTMDSNKRFTESEYFTFNEITKSPAVTVLNRRLNALYLISFTAIQQLSGR